MQKKEMDLQRFNDELDLNQLNENLSLMATVNFSKDMKFPSEDPVFSLMTLHSTWYSGEINSLHDAYQRLNGRLGGSTPSSFWHKPPTDGIVKMHVPIASDIASTSADLLFGEMPEVTIPEAEEAGENSREAQTQERLDEIIEESDIGSKLLEAGETASALGGVYLVPTWDSTIADYPILAINQPDTAIPEFKWGHLVRVTFHKVIDRREKQGKHVVYRLLECHEVGVIKNALFVGSDRELGKQIPLTEHPVTESLLDEINTGYDKLMPVYVPNVKPNRVFRGSSHGQSDLSGIEPLMDALDEVYSSWMRDVRLARGRIIVPESFLEGPSMDSGKKNEPYYDNDRAVYVNMSIDPLSLSGNPIVAQQFAIRSEDHRKTAYELLERIVSHAGYSPQTFGLNIDGQSQTGTALQLRERKSYTTRSKKWRHWKSALQRVFETMLFIDKEILGNRDIDVFRPNCKLGDSMAVDINSLSTAIQALANATAVSTDTKVRMLHPDWSEEQVEAEVERILEESGGGSQAPAPDEFAPDVTGEMEIDEFGNVITTDNLETEIEEEDPFNTEA